MSREYDAFGYTALKRGSSMNGRLSLPWVTSKIQNEETGLYYYGYRQYDPETGRWVSRDPIGEPGGENLYAFAGHDGVNRFDYLGNTSFMLDATGYRLQCRSCKCKITWTCKMVRSYYRPWRGHWGASSASTYLNADAL